MTHTVHTAAADAGLTLSELAERAALAHLWALRVLVVMDTTGCSASFAIRAVEHADAPPAPTYTAPVRGRYDD